MAAVKRIIYSRGFPYGAPLCAVRGGATKDPEVRAFLKGSGFTWNGTRFAWEHYLGRDEFRGILLYLQEIFGCEVLPKQGMDPDYVLDMTQPTDLPIEVCEGCEQPYVNTDRRDVALCRVCDRNRPRKEA